MDPRPTRQAWTHERHAVAAARWSGPALVGTALAAILGLGALRDRFPHVPNLTWVLSIAGLLIGGGVRMAAARRLEAARIAHQQRVARSAIVVGGAALALGVLSVREDADVWIDAARAAGALALCGAFALLPFGVALLRRTIPMARLHAAAEAERRAWLATAHVPIPTPSPPSSEGTEPPAER